MVKFVKFFDRKINLIKFLANSVIYYNWCHQFGCTTCGARDLRANLIDCAIQKYENKFNKDIRITFEGKIRHNELVLFKMPNEEKSILVGIICKELKELNEEDINQLNPEFLRFIVLDIWVALNRDTDEILRITEGYEIFKFISRMKRHYDSRRSTRFINNLKSKIKVIK